MLHRNQNQEMTILPPEILLPEKATTLQEAVTEDHKTLKFNLKHGSFDRVFFY